MIRLTVLGSSGTYPAAGRACSGYLLEAGVSRADLDRLRQRLLTSASRDPGR